MPNSSESADSEQISQLLSDVAGSKPGAAAELLPLVYNELRKLAQRRMERERKDHTLQATGLVHEAYLKMVGGAKRGWSDRAHFYRAAAQAMRHILIDHARARAGPKRGGKTHRKIPIDVIDLATEADPTQIIAIDELITRLEAEDADAAEVVRLRFYAGLTIDETSETLKKSSRTVKRDWLFARAFLLRHLQDD